MWIWVLVGVVALLVILYYYNSREHLTNDQLISTLKTFGEQGNSSSKVGEPSVKPIYGPSANPPPLPTNGGGMNGKTVAGPYPQIFGPDVTNAPGTTRSIGGSGGDLSGGGTGGGGGGSGGGGSGGGGGGGGSGGGSGGGGACNNSSGKVISDEPPPYESHEFNPDLAKAFPMDGPPQPFLTDFSRIQH